MNFKTLTTSDRRVWLSYFAVYLVAGLVMNSIGQWMEIARFANWWQIITCYGCYLVPVSLLVKHRSVFDQYLYGLFFLGLLEVGGYTLGTSIAYENNLLYQVFSERNFSLVMTLFFACILPVGNYTLNAILTYDYRRSPSKSTLRA